MRRSRDVFEDVPFVEELQMTASVHQDGSESGGNSQLSRTGFNRYQTTLEQVGDRQNQEVRELKELHIVAEGVG